MNAVLALQFAIDRLSRIADNGEVILAIQTLTELQLLENLHKKLKERTAWTSIQSRDAGYSADLNLAEKLIEESTGHSILDALIALNTNLKPRKRK